VAKQTPITPWFGVPSNRQEALRIGHPHYFTGKPCIHGHLSNRDSKDRKCLQCELIFVRKRAHRPEIKAKFLVWSRANKDKRRSAHKKSRIKHREKVLGRMRDWYARNKEIQSEKRKIWAAANKPKIYAHNAARRAREILATPPWASSYKAEFEAIYAERERIERETGIKHHVDHIYPLRGKTSCGLHVPWNLQVITATENLRKNNRAPKDTTGSQMESGLSQQCAGLRSSAVHADMSTKQTSGL